MQPSAPRLATRVPASARPATLMLCADQSRRGTGGMPGSASHTRMRPSCRPAHSRMPTATRLDTRTPTSCAHGSSQPVRRCRAASSSCLACKHSSTTHTAICTLADTGDTAHAIAVQATRVAARYGPVRTKEDNWACMHVQHAGTRSTTAGHGLAGTHLPPHQATSSRVQLQAAVLEGCPHAPVGTARHRCQRACFLAGAACWPLILRINLACRTQHICHAAGTHQVREQQQMMWLVGRGS